MSGVPTDVTGVDKAELPAGTESYVQITGISEGSPAEDAGIMAGDKILKAGENEVYGVEDLQNYTAENQGVNVTLTLNRQGETIQKEVFSRENGNGQGAIGVSLSEVAIISYSPLEAIKAGFVHTKDLTVYILQYLKQTLYELFTTGGTTTDVSGPIGMVSMTQQAAQMGFVVLLNFMALISVNLGIVNILPLPALDGGRIVFLLIEKIKKSPVSTEFEAKIHNAGFMMLMLLMLVVTVKDIAKLGVWGKIMGMF
jgi:regulator of sigma E protease